MPNNIKYLPIGIIISSPSGGGKSSVTRAILAKDLNIKLSVSVTTRKPRPSEKEGINYFFKTKEEFIEMQKNGLFLETSEIYGNLYGTPKEYVDQTFDKGNDVVFDVDFVGATSIKNHLKHRAISIFIMPPSLEILKERLIKRGEDDMEAIMTRIKSANQEMEYSKYYDSVVINEDFDKTVQSVESIISLARSNLLRGGNE